MAQRVSGGISTRVRWRLLMPSILALLLVVASPSPAARGAEQGDWEIGFDAGYGIFDSGALESDLDAGHRVGLRSGLFVTDRIEFEGQVSYGESRGDCGWTDCRDVDTTLKTWFLNGVLHWRSRQDGLRPYALLGFGRSRLAFEGEIDAEDASRAYQGGAGARIDHGWLGARFELLVARDRTFDDPSTHVAFGVGIMLRIGPHRTGTPPP